ncbi:hypothetical protein TNCV_4990741 [Trichonephila clavipes]|nr:hypothetical protein TNCV_4990741 [Trichonephila clavipes]
MEFFPCGFKYLIQCSLVSKCKKCDSAKLAVGPFSRVDGMVVSDADCCAERVYRRSLTALRGNIVSIDYRLRDKCIEDPDKCIEGKSPSILLPPMMKFDFHSPGLDERRVKKKIKHTWCYQVCPTGVVNESTFKDIFGSYFPQGGK